MIVSKIFKVKDISEVNLKSNQNSLKKNLSLFKLVMLGVGMVVGAGIFVLTGLAAGNYAGPAVTLSFAISALICICAGFCYAEFASMMNASGSVYSYLQVSFGEFPAWIIGMTTIIGYFLGAACVASGWSRYLVDLLQDFGVLFPAKFTNPFGQEVINNGAGLVAYFDLPAIAITIATSCILYRGIQLSSMITSILVYTKAIVLISFIIVGSMYIDYHNWVPYIPKNNGTFGGFGMSGIIVGASTVFIAFNGFDSVCAAAQETKNPKRDIPASILLTIFIVTIIYILTSLVLTGLVKYDQLGVPESFAIAVKKINLPFFGYFIEVGALAGLCSVILVSLYTVIRMILVIATDQLLPSFLSRVHPKFRTPHITTIIICLIMIVVLATVDLGNIIKLSSFFIIISTTSVCCAVIYMRYKKPTIRRAFKCPFMPILPSISILLSGYILTTFSNNIYFVACYIAIMLTFIYIAVKMTIKNHEDI